MKTSIAITEREFLQRLRETANGMCAGNMNPDWVRAYRSLADAADRLDAMTARTEEVPAEGWCTDTPENQSTNQT